MDDEFFDAEACEPLRVTGFAGDAAAMEFLVSVNNRKISILIIL
jgi:hypothetical protein